MTITNPRASFGLNARVTPTKAGSNGSLQVGTNAETVNLTLATKIVSFDAVIVGTTSDLILDLASLSNTGSTAWTAGVAQVETNTIVAAGGCTSDGNMTLVVTSSGMTGSPKNVVVALTTTAHTTAALIATAARTALAADTAVAARFTIGGTGAIITLTRKPTSTYTVNSTAVNVFPADDATANLNIPAGLGVTASATSTNTTAGVATAGSYSPDLDGTDFEGEATGGTSNLYAVRIANSTSSLAPALLTKGTELNLFEMTAGTTLQVACAGGPIESSSNIKIEPLSTGDNSCFLNITLMAGA